MSLTPDTIIDDLVAHASLNEAFALTKKYARNLWEKQYTKPQYKFINQHAAVWLDIYPLSQLLGKNKKNILQTLADPKLLKALQDLGIKMIHTNPMREAGGITPGLEKYPSTDGGYDRVEYNIARVYGSNQDYQDFVSAAKKYGIEIGRRRNSWAHRQGP